MTIYLGSYGRVALRRSSSEGTRPVIISKSDINLSRRSFGTDLPKGVLVTGDQIEITSTSMLNFISSNGWPNHSKSTKGNWFVHVDQLYSIRLYTRFSDALTGNISNAILLESISTDITVNLRIVNGNMRMLGAVKSYEINTNRDLVDTTALAEDFKSQYSGLISGSGRMSCLWDYSNVGNVGSAESANYLLQLLLRTEAGSDFKAEFYLKTEKYNPSKHTATATDNLYYLVDGVLTNTVVAFQPDNVVEMTADFVTTGAIELRVVTEPVFTLTVQDGDRILTRTGDSSVVLVDLIPTS